MLGFALINLSEGAIDVIELFTLVVNIQAFCFSNSLIFPLFLELVQLIEDSLAFLQQSLQFFLHVVEVRRRRSLYEVVVANIERVVSTLAASHSLHTQNTEPVALDSRKQKFAIISQDDIREGLRVHFNCCVHNSKHSLIFDSLLRQLERVSGKQNAAVGSAKEDSLCVLIKVDACHLMVNSHSFL